MSSNPATSLSMPVCFVHRLARPIGEYQKTPILLVYLWRRWIAIAFPEPVPLPKTSR